MQKNLSKKIVFHAMLLLVGISVSLLGVEIYLRLAHPQLTFSRVQTFTFQCFEEGEHRWIKLRKNHECLLSSLYNAFAPVVSEMLTEEKR